MSRPADRDLLLLNARLLDGAGSHLDQASVLVRAGRIQTVGDAEELARATGAPRAERIDLAGRTLLPGLIDAHVHLSAYDPLPAPLRGEPPNRPELRYFVLANAARDLLRMGVTTVRDVGSIEDHALALRSAVGLGLCRGPRILTCGRIISATAPGGVIFGSMYREADGPDDVRRAVREQLRRGADFVKVMATGARSVLLEDPEPAQLTAAELDALVAETHRLGKRVAAHAEGLGGTALAVAAGVDTIEHGLSLHRDPALLDQMAARGTVLVPTLSTFHDVAETHAAKYPPALVEQAKRQREEAYRTLAAARRAGVTLALGFDSYPAGGNALELVRMVDGGLSPREALVAAGAGAARACGLPDAGVVRPGAVADLLAVDGDPLADISLLTRPERIWLVIQAGMVAGRSGALIETRAGELVRDQAGTLVEPPTVG